MEHTSPESSETSVGQVALVSAVSVSGSEGVLPVCPPSHEGVNAVNSVRSFQPFGPLDFPPSSSAAIVDTTARWLWCDVSKAPVTVANRNAGTYLCSPSTAYGPYAAFEARRHVSNPVLGVLAASAFHATRPLWALANWDKQVQLNNWLWSTNPVPSHLAAVLPEAVESWRERCPDHAVVLRSLNPMTDGDVLAVAQATGARLVPSRRVFVVPKPSSVSSWPGPSRVRRELAQDLKLCRQRLWSVDEVFVSDVETVSEALHLYIELYRHHHTPLNPRYTLSHVLTLMERGCLRVFVLREESRVLGMTGVFLSDRVCSTPLFGVVSEHPHRGDVYRAVSRVAFDVAKERDAWLNLSAGAEPYKKARGGVAVLEVMAVWDGHLSWLRRQAGSVLEALLSQVARWL